MEFVAHDTGQPLDAAAQKRVRSQAMKTFRRRQRERLIDQTGVPRSSTSFQGSRVSAEARSHVSTRSQDQDAFKTQPSQKAVSGADLGTKANTIPREIQDGDQDPFKCQSQVAQLICLCGHLFGSMQTWDTADKTMSVLSRAWEASNSPMVLGSLALAAYGTLEALGVTLPRSLSYKVKARVLHELRLRLFNTNTAISDAVELALMSLVDFEQSSISPEAIYHLHGMQKVMSLRRQHGKAPGCLHYYLILELTDLAIATWMDLEPVLIRNTTDDSPLYQKLEKSDQTTADGPAPTLRLDTVAMLLFREAFAINDYPPINHASLLKRVPKLFFMFQTCIQSIDRQGHAPTHEVVPFLEDLTAFGQTIHLVSHYKPLSEDSIALLRGCHNTLAILYNNIINLDNHELLIDKDLLFRDIQSLTDHILHELPFTSILVLLTAGCFLKTRMERKICKVMLTKIFYRTVQKDWPRLQAFMIEYHKLIFSFRHRTMFDRALSGDPAGTTASPSNSIQLQGPPSSSLTVQRKTQGLRIVESGLRMSATHTYSLVSHRSITPSSLADEKFYIIAGREGPWVAVDNQILSAFFKDARTQQFGTSNDLHIWDKETGV